MHVLLHLELQRSCKHEILQLTLLTAEFSKALNLVVALDCRLLVSMTTALTVMCGHMRLATSVEPVSSGCLAQTCTSNWTTCMTLD